MGRLIVVFLGVGSLISAWVILFVIFSQNDQSTGGTLSESVQQTPRLVLEGRQVIRTWGGDEFSADSLLRHSDTTAVVSGEFYKNSADSDQYEIYFDQLSGNVGVQLTGDQLSLARSLAESQLTRALSVSNSRLCDLRIKVNVHAAVSPEFSRYENLGLSFCPGAVQLP